nr:hypothetical protein [Tanacetum cinerariifolium]
MFTQSSCSRDDGTLVDGASWSIDVDTCESTKSTSLGASATGTGETAIVGGLKYSSNIEIQGLYERQKRLIDDFKPMDSDDALDKEKVVEEPDNIMIEVKQEGDEENIKKRPGRRLKMKAIKKSKRQKTNSDLKEEEHLNTFLLIVLDKEEEVNYEILNKRFPIINWESKFYHLD